jgi:hypothetical protein
LLAAKAASVIGIDPSAEAIQSATRNVGKGRFSVGEPVVIPHEENSFDLVTCFGWLQDPLTTDLIGSEIRRVLRPEGLLFASLATSTASRDEPLEVLRQRFAAVDVHRESLLLWCGIDAIATTDSQSAAAGTPATADEVAAGPILIVAGSGSTPVPAPVSELGAAGLVDALCSAVGTWEERARNAEAEVAAMRWENRIAGEKLTAVVNRLHELENERPRMLSRLLQGKSPRVSHQELADPPRRPSGDGG